MTEVKGIVCEDYQYNESCNETEIYFEGPTTYLNGKYKYSEADGYTFLLRYPGKEWNVNDAVVEISPFEDYDNERTDYDWCSYSCDPEFKQALYDIYKNGLS